ncbi:MAG: hypothetical protein B6244_06005 [Candidatus Cloacimonetes bacterium 4572_55]|nr:MAG: hypothetical protein B6244_06005 [Candidatus Cloacimonetes bacterium 4572_55]
MDHRVIDILVYLANQLREVSIENLSGADQDDMEMLISSLQKEGYSPAEIDSALNWFFENEEKRSQLYDPRIHVQPTKTIRILHPIEKIIIKPEAYGFLLQAHQLGLIRDEQLELIIERALLTGWEVDLNIIKALTSFIIFSYASKDANEIVNKQGAFRAFF